METNTIFEYDFKIHNENAKKKKKVKSNEKSTINQ